MALIPRLDSVVTLFDAGYNVRFDEADTSTDLGCFHIGIVEPTPGSTITDGSMCNANTNPPECIATFPVYNSQNSAITPATENRYLGPVSSFNFPTDQSGPFAAQTQVAFDGQLWWVLDISNIFATGAIMAKAEQTPGTLSENSPGMVSLNITNPDQYAVFGVYAVNFQSGGQGGILISALNFNTGFTDFLIVDFVALANNLPVTWVNDGMPGIIGVPARTWPLPTGGRNHNYQADFSAAPTVTVYVVNYSYTPGNVPIQDIAVLGTGDLPTDPLNAFQPSFGIAPFFCADFTSSAAPNQAILFGIDWGSGNNTGCWFLTVDCSRYGQMTFTMPDASLGPSSDPSVYWVQRLNSNVFIGPTGIWNYYPQTDRLGNWYWLRVPLCDLGTFDMIVEPLTGEVYVNIAPPPPSSGGAIVGTFVGTFGAGHIGGGTK